MKDNLPNSERRTHPRLAWQSQVKFRPHKSGMEWEKVPVQNISLGGCYFYSSYPYQPGELIEIHMESKFLKGTVKFTGTVKRCEKKTEDSTMSFGLAIHFVEILQDERDAFITALKQKAIVSKSN